MKKLTNNEFSKRSYQLHDNIIILSEYQGLRHKVIIRCLNLDDIGHEHGEYTTAADSLLNQGRGCKKCANDKRSDAQTQFLHNKIFFSVPDRINCYWAGFIAADGCIVDNRHLTIGLKAQDRDHLSCFCRDIEYNGTIYNSNVVLHGKTFSRCEIQIANAERIIHDLKLNFKISSKKSLSYTHPDMTGDLALAFIKGYIDGDGYIDVVKRKRLHVCGTHETLSWIKNIFDEIAPAQSTNGMIAEVRKQGSISVYEIGGNRVIKILKMMADLSVPGLPRKWKCIS